MGEVKPAQGVLPTVRLEYLDDFNMTSEPVWGPMTPGQISGLAYDPSQKSFFAISDDRYNPDDKRSRGHPRFYQLTMSISQNAIRFSDQFKFTYLKDKKGKHIPFEKGDGEGIVILPNGNLAIATEGWAEMGLKIDGRVLPLANPSIDEFRRDGKWVRAYRVPDYYRPEFSKDGKQTQGVFRNNGFESLTQFKDTLFTATEGPLVQDGGPATFEKGGLARILVLNSKRNGAYAPTQEFAYPIDPIPVPSSWGTERPESGENGISEMLAIDNNTLLVLERSFATKPYWRNHVRLYQVDLRGATNTLREKTLSETVRPVKKELVFDFEELLPKLEPKGVQKNASGVLENYEAMAVVNLPDGTRGLVIVSDNNHNHPHQRQTALLFRLK